MKLLVTGGAGFIGSNFIRYVMDKHPQWEITNLDSLTYAGNLENLTDVQNKPGYTFVHGDIADRRLLDIILKKGIDTIVNFAAESHVDRSILDTAPFIKTNIEGTHILLDTAMNYPLKKFIHTSTDEVYGSIEKGSFIESSSLSATNPYAASKVAAEAFCHAYWKTYGIPIVTVRSSNNYGPYQFPEKLIPLTITNALEDNPIPVYGDGQNVRDWLFVIDHCRALDIIIQKGVPGEIYNVGGRCEKTNIEVVQRILEMLNKPKSLIQFTADRPGHDFRYSMNIDKIKSELGWQPTHSFDESLVGTVNWYTANESWWQRIKKGEYIKYHEIFSRQKQKVQSKTL